MTEKTRLRIYTIVVFIITFCIILLLFRGYLLLKNKIEGNNVAFEAMYLKHAKRGKTDTIVIKEKYIVEQVKVVEKPVLVKEYTHTDTVIRKEIEKSTLVLGAKYNLNSLGKLKSFSVATIDTTGKVRASFYKVPLLVKEIKLMPDGRVEYKKRKLVAVKVITGIAVGSVAYSIARKKI
jgi:hypothetical protein